MKILKSIIALCLFVALVGIYGCDSMTDNFKQYTEENNYSGKVSNLRISAGYERVILEWDNPKDQKSKSIKIVYGPDSLVKTYDTLVETASIDGLNAGTGYEFTVFTADAHGNLSIPSSITAFPISEAFVNSLTAPSAIVQTKGADQYVTVMGLSNVVMSFAGEVEVTLSGEGVNGTYKFSDMSKKGANEVDIPVTAFGVESLLTPGTYTYECKASVYPIMSNLVSVDDVELERASTIGVLPVVINLMTIDGTITANPDNTGNEGENVTKIIDSDRETKFYVGRGDGGATKPVDIIWHMSRPFACNKYAITTANDSDGRDPKEWEISGSHDGENWVRIDYHNDYTFPRDNNGSIIRKNRVEFDLPSTTEAYSYYRMYVYRTTSTGFQIADWILYYDSAK